jgi:oligopeptide transport system substrate-binding protein
MQMQILKLDFQEGDLPSLHPHDLPIYLRGIAIVKTLFEGLTRIDDQGQAKLSGAQSVEVSPDRLHYTFTLRENRWSNGTPVTAFQYEMAMKEVLSPTSTCPRSELLFMINHGKEAHQGKVLLDQVGVKALDAKTLVIDLAYPSPYLFELLALPVCLPLIDPKKKEITEFNGAFMVTKWEKGNLLQLKPNPHFWNRKQVSIPQIDIYMVQDTTTAFSLFKEGKIDYIGIPFCNLTAEQIIRLQETKTLRTKPFDRVFWIHLNTTHPALSSPFIRQALSMAIRRQEVTKHILIGGEPLFTPLPSNVLPMTNPIEIKEDLVEARKRFAQGLKELGFTKETFPTLTISYSQQANRKQFAEYLQQSWASAFGIKVELDAKDWTTLRNNLPKGLFDVSFSYQAHYYKDPAEFLDYFSTLGSANYPQWIHPLYTEKMSSAMKAKEFQKRIKLLGEAEQLLLEQMPLIPICTDKLMFAHNPDLSGYVFDCIGAIDLSYATLKKK